MLAQLARSAPPGFQFRGGGQGVAKSTRAVYTHLYPFIPLFGLTLLF